MKLTRISEEEIQDIWNTDNGLERAVQAQIESCEKEAQEKMREIKEEIETFKQANKDINLHFIFDANEWRAFWQKYLEGD